MKLIIILLILTFSFKQIKGLEIYTSFGINGSSCVEGELNSYVLNSCNKVCGENSQIQFDLNSLYYTYSTYVTQGILTCEEHYIKKEFKFKCEEGKSIDVGNKTIKCDSGSKTKYNEYKSFKIKDKSCNSKNYQFTIDKCTEGCNGDYYLVNRENNTAISYLFSISKNSNCLDSYDNISMLCLSGNKFLSLPSENQTIQCIDSSSASSIKFSSFLLFSILLFILL